MNQKHDTTKMIDMQWNRTAAVCILLTRGTLSGANLMPPALHPSLSWRLFVASSARGGYVVPFKCDCPFMPLAATAAYDLESPFVWFIEFEFSPLEVIASRSVGWEFESLPFSLSVSLFSGFGMTVTFSRLLSVPVKQC